MPKERIDKIESFFDDVYNFIREQPGSILDNLTTTGGVCFNCEAKITRDQRRFISLPQGNRIYEGDWGYYFNSMGKDGQWIGQYSIPINEKYLELVKT